jgi:hypothetical protein
MLDGIVISVYSNEHPPPHFHARFAEHQAVFDIAGVAMVEGFLPVAKRRIVLEWAATRREQLLRAFTQAASHERVDPIE